MKKFELRSEYPCLIKWQESEAFLDEASSLIFETAEILYVYPATGCRGDIAFTLDLSQPSKIFCECYNLDQQTLCLLTSKSKKVLKVKEKTSVKGKEVSVCISQNETSFETDDRIVIAQTIHPKTYELSSFENFAILKIKDSSQEQILLFNIDSAKLFSEEANIIEFNSGELSCQKNGKEEKYSIVNGEIVKSKTFEPALKNEKIIAYKFLEKIKNHEFKVATTFLSDSLNSSEEKLSAYFGEIKKIIPLSISKFLVVKKSGYYVVRFEVKDEKISNIEILD